MLLLLGARSHDAHEERRYGKPNRFRPHDGIILSSTPETRRIVELTLKASVSCDAARTTTTPTVTALNAVCVPLLDFAVAIAKS